MARWQKATELEDLREEAEMIDVSSALPTADERWVYTDQAGHEHRYQRRAFDDYYPTLTWVIDETYWCEDCGDEHTEGHYECPLCGERIRPGLKGPSMFREFIPGRVTYWLGAREISPEEYQRRLAERGG